MTRARCWRMTHATARTRAHTKGSAGREMSRRATAFLRDAHVTRALCVFTGLAIAACTETPIPGRARALRLAGLHTAVAQVPARPAVPDTLPSDSGQAAPYEGVDARGIPHYATAIAVSADDAALLRRAYGVEDPHRLYVSDSTEEGILKYDTQVKRCPSCYVNSYRVGYVSVRRPGETWEQAERRVRATPAHTFTGSTNPESRSTADLDPDVRPLTETMLRDARAAGFRLHVTATYRSPLREAFLMAEGAGRTHTLTSNHSYGRALDVVIDDGNRGRPQTKRNWISFRRWVIRYRTASGQTFRILGTVERTWDWPHVELPSSTIGFDTIDEALARARACGTPGPLVTCNFPPHLPLYLSHGLVQ